MSACWTQPVRACLKYSRQHNGCGVPLLIHRRNPVFPMYLHRAPSLPVLPARPNVTSWAVASTVSALRSPTVVSARSSRKRGARCSLRTRVAQRGYRAQRSERCAQRRSRAAAKKNGRRSRGRCWARADARAPDRPRAEGRTLTGRRAAAGL
jgi:hypothetical protein